MPDHATAFAPGRVNLIGEHTDYNDGLALPFAITQGVTVRAEALPARRIEAVATDLGERDVFELDGVQGAPGWRAFVRGAAAELQRVGVRLRGARLVISADLPRDAGLSSSAALEVATALALLALTDVGAAPTGVGEAEPTDLREAALTGVGEAAPTEVGEAKPTGVGELGLARLDVARICARIESRWVGAQTGMLDQVASLYGQRGCALRIDFRSLAVRPVRLELGAFRLVTIDSGERRANTVSGYNERRAECARACEWLGVASLRDVTLAMADRLPAPLDRRARHVISENERVEHAVAVLARGDITGLGALLDASHASLRDGYEVCTPAVQAAVERLRGGGALGARLIGGGYGGHVLGLLGPGTGVPAGAIEVRPESGARLLERR
ncbi:MAG: galactokinase [Solirubrobacteraceae bacterium]